MQKQISIVGGGLVGAVLACYLAKRGCAVNIFERRSDMRQSGYAGGRSINLALSNRGWAALDKIGLRAAIEQIAIPMTGRIIHDLDSSTTYIPYGKAGQAIYSVSRGELNKTLIVEAEKYPDVKFHFDEELVQVNFSEAKIILENTRYKTRHEVTSDFVFGADGAYSELRYEMQKTPHFNFSQTHESYGYKELHIPAGKGGNFLLAKNALHIWPRKSFMMIALPNLDGSFTCTLFASFVGENSFAQLQTESDIRDFFATQFPSAVGLMPTLLEDFFKNPTSSLVTMRCYPWVYGRTALIGDAAHAIVPFYGQGMNCGFEDVRLLNSFLETYSDWHQALAAWQISRKPNADAIADLALYNFIEMRDLTAQPAFQQRMAIEKKIAASFPEKFSTLYSMVTFDQTPYAEAKARAEKQNELLDEIMRLNITDEETIMTMAKNWLDHENKK